MVSKLSSRVAVLLGHVIGVALRLKETKTKKVNNGRVVIEEKRVSTIVSGDADGQDAVVNFYSTNILGSKTVVPRYASVSSLV